jgi:hypothetical protein
MERILRAAALVVVFGIATLATALPGKGADLGAIQKSADQFVALGRNAYQSGQVPRASDANVKALLDVVLDTSDLALAPPSPFDQIANLSNRLLAITHVGLVYTLAGTGFASLDDLAKATDINKLTAQVNHNTVFYAVEMGRYFDAQLVVSGAMIRCVAAKMHSDPKGFDNDQSRRGVAGMQSGVTQTVNGVLQTLGVPGLSGEWQRARIVAIVAIAPDLVKFLAPQQRKELHDTALGIAQQTKGPVLKAGLGGLAEILGG